MIENLELGDIIMLSVVSSVANFGALELRRWVEAFIIMSGLDRLQLLLIILIVTIP